MNKTSLIAALCTAFCAFEARAQAPDFCSDYAKHAVEQVQLMLSHPNCRVPASPRWQPDYTKHFNGCRTGTEAHMTAELAARNSHLVECGAIPQAGSTGAGATPPSAAASVPPDIRPPEIPEANASVKSEPAPAIRRDSPSPEALAVDSGTVQPLNLRSGCWEVRVHTSLESSATTSPDYLKQRQREVDNSLRQAIANFEGNTSLTPAQRAQGIEMAKATAAAAMEAVKAYGAPGESHGDVPADIVCTPSPFLNEGKDIFGTRSAGCSRITGEKGSVRQMRVTCPNRTSEYERGDAENFKATTKTGTEQNSGESAQNGLTIKYGQTVVTRAKWVGEATAHMPYSTPRTDLDGVRPRGPQAVAWLDRFRIVARIDDKSLTALQAYLMLSMLPPSAVTRYGPRLSDVLQEMYMRESIAVEAAKQSLGVWDDPTLCTGSQGGIHCGSQSDYPQMERAVVIPELHGAPAEAASTIRLEMLTSSLHDVSDAYQRAVDRLWTAYFNQAKTSEARTVLLRTVKDRYRITVTDPDFFDQERAAASPAQAR